MLPICHPRCKSISSDPYMQLFFIFIKILKGRFDQGHSGGGHGGSHGGSHGGFDQHSHGHGQGQHHH